MGNTRASPKPSLSWIYLSFPVVAFSLLPWALIGYCRLDSESVGWQEALLLLCVVLSHLCGGSIPGSAIMWTVGSSCASSPCWCGSHCLPACIPRMGRAALLHYNSLRCDTTAISCIACGWHEWRGGGEGRERAVRVAHRTDGFGMHQHNSAAKWCWLQRNVTSWRSCGAV